MKYVLAIDQGTTSSRAILYDKTATKARTSQKEFTQIFPQSGWVEHDAEEIWSTQLQVVEDVVAAAEITMADIAAIGVTNQRETTIVWDRLTGKPIYNAIVWQDRRTAQYCDQLAKDGHGDMITDKTGLLLDAYFSATKVRYILDQVEGAQERAVKGELAFGTVDSWIIYKLTAGKKHITDPSNASRTMLFNIHTLRWDADLLRLFDIPSAMLPEVVDSSGHLAMTDVSILGHEIAISGIAGDQQAALFGQLCVDTGMCKNTYGTGCFMVVNTGDTAVRSSNKLLTTIGWKIGDQVTYALEGSVFVAGSAVQWLRDGLGIIDSATETSDMATAIDSTDGVIFVPALTGLAAPYWDQYARGTIVGINRGTTRNHIVRATLDGIAFQVKDVVDAMALDLGSDLTALKVDGGGARNSYLMQTQADLLQCQVEVSADNETTALGAAYLAGLAVGYWDGVDELLSMTAGATTYEPQREVKQVKEQHVIWQKAVQRSKNWQIDQEI